MVAVDPSAARAGAPTTCGSGESQRFCANHLRAGRGGACPSACVRLDHGAEGDRTPREHAGGARVRPASCLPGRGKHRATVALHLVSSTVLFARARADDAAPSAASKPAPTWRERRPRAASSHSLPHLAPAHKRGRRAVMGWETRLGAPAGWPGTLGDGPGRRTRLVAHREARLRGQPGLVDVFLLISHSRPIAAAGAQPQVLSSHLPKFGARARKMASFLLPWAAVAK